MTFKNQAAQGDVLFRRIDAVPATAKKRKKAKGALVIAHSETQHHHQFASGIGITVFDDPGNSMICYLRMDSPRMLEHMRPFDTHAPIMFSAGIYEVRRQREHTPEGWRIVAD